MDKSFASQTIYYICGCSIFSDCIYLSIHLIFDALVRWVAVSQKGLQMEVDKQLDWEGAVEKALEDYPGLNRYN